MEIMLPYGTTYLKTFVDDKRIAGLIQPQFVSASDELSAEAKVKEALVHPIASERLSHLARDKKRILIITSDHTRPVPSKITMPLLLEEVRSENKAVEIKIIIATGSHRATTQQEMVEKFGKDIVDRECIVNHDSKNKQDLIYFGLLPSKGELWLNSLVKWADFIVAEGFIEPHFFAGYSGGRKSMMPGIASYETVLANHCAEFIANPFARTGNLKNNPIHQDMIDAAKKAGLAFILNVVIDADKHVIKAYAGHPERAHEQGCAFVDQYARVKGVQAPIVITSNSGYPLDQNIYQAVKGMTAAEACVEKGGVIIIAASCVDGHGGEAFYEWFAEADSPAGITEKISRTPKNKTLPDQWQAQILARILEKAVVIMITDQKTKKLVKDMHMKHAASLDEALQAAQVVTGSDASITIIPDGVGVIIE